MMTNFVQNFRQKALILSLLAERSERYCAHSLPEVASIREEQS